MLPYIYIAYMDPMGWYSIVKSIGPAFGKISDQRPTCGPARDLAYMEDTWDPAQAVPIDSVL